MARRARRRFLDSVHTYTELIGSSLNTKASAWPQYQDDLDAAIARYKKSKSVNWQLSRIGQADEPGVEVDIESYIRDWLDLRLGEIAKDLVSHSHRPSPAVKRARIASNSALAAVGLAVHARMVEDEHLFNLAVCSLKPPRQGT